MSAYFIAGVGTGVGKTFTTCALLHAARAAGRVARGYKPILSGWDATDATNDAAEILRAMGQEPHAVEAIAPWRFQAPLSPHRAAALEGREIALAPLVRWSMAQTTLPGLALIEGVGGVMVPLNTTQTTLDWMEALALPVIMVTGSYLGSISHCLTALAALRARGLLVQAVVMNETPESTVTLAEAEAGLAPFVADIPWRVVQPRVSSPREATAIHALCTELV